MNNVSSVFDSPDIFPEKIDLPNMKLHCCNMSAECYKQSPFLDHRLTRKNDEPIILEIRKLIRGLPEAPPAAMHFVFHNAFCCSTLYSRCLDTAKQLLVLREPNILMESASIYRFRGTQMLPSLELEAADNIFSLTTAMLSRRYSDQSDIVIKPSDACNNLMSKLLDLNPHNRAILMFSDLERFLIAILKHPQRMEWIKIRATELTLDEMQKTGKAPVDPQSMNDVSMAAYVWVLHMKKMRGLQQQYGQDRVRSLNSEAFMALPVEAVSEGLSFFRITPEAGELQSHIDSILSSHSKASDLDYSYKQREQDFIKQKKKFIEQVDAGVGWAISQFGESSITSLRSQLI